MPRLRSENPLIHFVLREIPLTKTKTIRFDERWLVKSSEPSGQWLLCEISLWKSKVKHVDDFLYRKPKQYVSVTLVYKLSIWLGRNVSTIFSRIPRPEGRAGCVDGTCGTSIRRRFRSVPVVSSVVGTVVRLRICGTFARRRCRSTPAIFKERWLGFYFRLRYSFNTRVCSEPQSLEVAMPRLRAEIPLIHFVSREIPLTKSKTTGFDGLLACNILRTLGSMARVRNLFEGKQNDRFR